MNKEFSSLDESAKKNQMESVTPYKVAVVVFIKIYCTDTRIKGKYFKYFWKKIFGSIHLKICIEVIAEKRDFCVAALKLIQVTLKNSWYCIWNKNLFVTFYFSHQI